MKLVVGLGNPGTQYERTRHNVGFMVLERLARKLNASNWRAAHESHLCDVLVGTEKVILLRPMTYMNLSGRAVASAMQFYKLGIDDLLVVSDDVALPCGTLRLRASGSSGGHNGLADIERAVSGLAALAGKTPLDYARLRLGVDPPGRVPQKAYVLEAFSSEQIPKMETAIQKAGEAIECWVSQGMVTAMNRFNVRES